MSQEPLVFVCPSCLGVNRVRPDKLADGPRCGRCQTPLAVEGKPLAVDDEGLERVVRAAPVPVVVDFWAPWCGPCRMVAPAVEQLARETAGRRIVLKVNTDEHSRGFAALGARGIPTFARYEGGRLVQKREGALPLPALRDFAA